MGHSGTNRAPSRWGRAATPHPRPSGLKLDADPGKELPKGMLRVRLRLNSLEEVERLVLSMGTHATVIRLDALRERLFKATHELFERYGGPTVIAGRDEG